MEYYGESPWLALLLLLLFTPFDIYYIHYIYHIYFSYYYYPDMISFVPAQLYSAPPLLPTAFCNSLDTIRNRRQPYRLTLGEGGKKKKKKKERKHCMQTSASGGSCWHNQRTLGPIYHGM
jgi:hypothetical protein